MCANAFERSAPWAPLFLLPFRMHSALRASNRLQFCAVWCPDWRPWCHCWELSGRWRQPQTVGEKPSLSLCSRSPSSASHINTGITRMSILSALLGWSVHWKLCKCLCSLLIQALIQLNYTSAQHYGWRVKNTEVSLLTSVAPGLQAVFCCLNPLISLSW